MKSITCPSIHLQGYNQSTTPVKSLHVKYCKSPPFSLILTEKKNCGNYFPFSSFPPSSEGIADSHLVLVVAQGTTFFRCSCTAKILIWKQFTRLTQLQNANVKFLFNEWADGDLISCLLKEIQQKAATQVPHISATLRVRGERQNKTQTREWKKPFLFESEKWLSLLLPNTAKYKSSNQGAKVHNFRDATTRFQE